MYPASLAADLTRKRQVLAQSPHGHKTKVLVTPGGFREAWWVHSSRPSKALMRVLGDKSEKSGHVTVWEIRNNLNSGVRCPY